MRRPGIEPYDRRHLVKFLKKWGAEMRPQGAKSAVYVLPNGGIVKCHDVKSTPVRTSEARRIAAAMGKTFAEFRADMGHPVVNGSKPRQQVRHGRR